ncbi:hypothetical protein K523DRAFT_422375, partial [Schizophyllum commune Tattone D]
MRDLVRLLIARVIRYGQQSLRAYLIVSSAYNPTRAPETFMLITAPITGTRTPPAGTGDWYGGYVADVLEHFLVDEGLSKIAYVSPMNEPDNNFGPSPCGQEGMEVTQYQRAEMITGLYSALVDRGLQDRIGILADESSSLSRATGEYADWLPQVIDMVAYLVHHTYDFPSDAYAADVADRFPGKATWMSEICCSLGEADGTGRGWSGGYDPTIANALMWSG